MKLKFKSIFAIIILLFFGATLNAQVSKEANFKVDKGDVLEASLSQGNINISTNNGNEVKVTAKNIQSDEVKLLTMDQKSGKIEIKFEGDDSDEFELDMSIPSTLNLDISSGGGNISVTGNVDGKVDVSTGGGNITLQKINGTADLSTGGGTINTGDIYGNADLSTGGGEIKAGIINGTADLSTGGGNIYVESISNAADVSTAGGNIFVKNIGGSADLSTGGGNIQISEISGSADVSTGGGNISLENASGKVEVSSGAGNVELKNIKGSIDASTGSGTITSYLQPDGKNNSELSTGMGSIILYVPGNAKATIVATIPSQMWGSDKDELKNIKSDFEPTTIDRKGEPRQIKVTYVLNGGGSKIELSTGMGKIEIRKK